ncbi:MAG: sigma-70 family RNA polymerase sigma factor [Saprospiraceae bacterium]
METEKEKDLVAMILEGGTAREKALKTVYLDSKMKEKLIYFTKNNHGNEQDGEDLYQEAIIIFDSNIRKGNFRLEGSLSSYLFSIGKFHWMNHLRKKRLTLVEDIATTVVKNTSNPQPESLLIDAQKKEYLHTILAKLGKRCQGILELWQLSYSMEEIAANMGFHDASGARKAKYDCQQQLIKLIQSNPTISTELK